VNAPPEGTGALRPPARIAVLASGGGSNFQALVDHFHHRLPPDDRPGRIVLLVSDRPGAGALERARHAGIPTRIVPAAGRPEDETAAELLAALDEAGAELVALAGYLRRVPPAAVHRYEGRMVNIHPALLPAFGGPGMYGLHVHRAVLATGCRVSGATAHLVDEEYDHGPILAQWPVPVLPEDTPEHLAARVLRVEHMLYPAVVEALARGRRLEGPRGAEAFALVGSGAPDPDEVRRALGLEPLPAGAARSP